jgi:YggT family protein
MYYLVILDILAHFLYKLQVTKELRGPIMFVFTNFLSAVAYVIEILLNIYMWIVIARALLSWVNPDPYNPIVNFLYRATEPVLCRVRRIIPDLGGIDLSPLIVLLIIYFLKEFLVKSIYMISYRM